MQFDRLRIRGFKSFSDEVELPIGDGLTGIVGPNGCGKSNVVEALRWVMGESSARDLRGGEMDDVLFGGSALRPAFDVAEVALSVIKTEAETTNSDSIESNVFGLAEARRQQWGGELEVKRQIERGSGSTYRINNREVRARDVQLIFADAAAGSRSPAIISQGRVASIVEAKPEERRRFLEDAAGIGGLHSRRREAELKLNATDANLSRVRDRLNDIETDLASLQKQAREAERYRKLSDEIKYFEHLLLLSRLVEAEADQKACDDDTVAAKAQVDTTGEALAEIVGEVAKVAAELPALQGDITQLTAALAAGDERLARLKQQAEGYERERARIEVGIEQARRERTELSASLAAKRDGLPNSRLELDAIEQELETLKRLIPQNDAELEQARGLEKSLRQAVQDGLEAIAGKRAELGEVTRRIGEVQQRQSAIEEEVERARTIDDEALVKVADRQLAEARARLEGASAEQAEAERQKQEAAARLEEVGQRTEPLRAAAEQAAQAWQTLENERLRLQALADARDEKADDLERRSQRLTTELARVETEIANCDPTPLEERAGEFAETIEACETTLAELAEALSAALSDKAAADQSKAEKQQALDAQKSRLSAMETEAEALAALRGDADPDPILNRLKIDVDYETALSAALGDDLLFGKSAERERYWREIEAGMLPSWPAKLATLDRFVTGEPVLAIRLATVAVCDDAAQAETLQSSLKPGQRLVTKAGGLWRWDGYVQREGAVKASDERLRQSRRLTQLQGMLPRTRRSLADEEADFAACEAAVTAAALLCEEAKRAQATAERQLDECRREAVSNRERLSERRARHDRLVDERKRLSADMATVESERQAMAPEDSRSPQALAEHLAEAQGQASAAQEALQQAVSDAKRLEAEGRQLAGRAKAVGHTVEQARDAFVRAENLFERRQGEAEGRRQSRQQALAALATEFDTNKATLAEIEQAKLALSASLDDFASDMSARQLELEQAAQDAERLAQDTVQAKGRRDLLDERRQAQRSTIERLQTDIQTLGERDSQLASRFEEFSQAAQAIQQQAANEGVSAAQAENLAHRLDGDRQQLQLKQARRDELEAAHNKLLAAKDKASEDAIRARERLARAQSEMQRASETFQDALETARNEIGEAPERLLENVEIGEALKTTTSKQIEGQLNGLKTRRERIGAVNLRAASEIEERQASFSAMRDEEFELTQAIERLSSAIADLDREARKRLTAAFDLVDGHFRNLFTKLFGGGKAHLRLTNIDVPGKAGLELDAMPPGKKLQNISLLSGGEKGLTALALVFALFLSQPSPLCILDEVDAALDDANVERFVELMVEIARTTGTRFIVVTHHPLTMARMDRLFGVTMIERGVSRLVSVTLSTAVDMRSTA